MKIKEKQNLHKPAWGIRKLHPPTKDDICFAPSHFSIGSINNSKLGKVLKLDQPLMTLNSVSFTPHIPYPFPNLNPNFTVSNFHLFFRVLYEWFEIFTELCLFLFFIFPPVHFVSQSQTIEGKNAFMHKWEIKRSL